MNKLRLFSLFAVVVTALSSCGDKKEVHKTRYQGLSTEQVKEQLQSDAIDFVSQMEGMADEQAVKTLEVFNELLETNSPTLKSGKLRSSDGIVSINDFNGKFDWDASQQVWKKSDLDGKAEFNFPSTVNGTSNTERIVVSGVESEHSYTETETDWNYIGWDDVNNTSIYETTEYTTEYKLPKSLTATVSSGGKSVGSINVEATYSDTEQPLKTAKITFNLGQYTFALSANSASKSVVTASLKKGDLMLLNLSADASEKLDVDEPVYPTSSNLSLSIMDRIVGSGTANLRDYIAETEKLDDEYSDLSWYESMMNGKSKEYEEGMCAAFNKHVKIGLKDSEGTVIADLEMKPVLDEEDAYSYYQDGMGKWWDPITSKWVSEKPQYNFETWTSVPVLRFADGSTVEASVYFSKGFDQLFDKINKIMSKRGWN